MPASTSSYMTRVQRERFFNEADYMAGRTLFPQTDKLQMQSPTCDTPPAAPRKRIERAVDDDPRACYFKQVLNGKYIRMALILKLLGVE